MMETAATVAPRLSDRGLPDTSSDSLRKISAAPMNIVHVTRSLDPSAGGLPAVAVRLACAATEAGHHVSLLYEKRGTVGTTYDRVPGWSDVAHCAIPVLPFTAGLFGNIPRPVRQLVAEAHVVHLHGVWDTVVVTAARAARRAGVPYLAAPHGMLDPWCLAQRRWKKRLALAGPLGKMLRRAAALHGLNADEVRLWKPLGLNAPVHIIPNGIDPREFDAAPTEQSTANASASARNTGPDTAPPDDNSDFFRTRFGVPGNRVILFLGRLHHKKGLDLLGEAFVRLARRITDCHLVAIGQDEGAAAPLRALAADHSLSDRVHLPGPVFGPEKYAALRSAAVFCLPSRQEGFSVATLEAMACGTPVVISHDCHFDEVGQDGGGHVVSLDPQQIANALESLLMHPVAARAMGEKGRQLVQQRYTWQRSSQRTLEVYRQMLSQPARGLA